MNRLTIASDGSAAIDSEIGTGIVRCSDVPDGIPVHIHIIAVGKSHAGNTAFIDVIADDLHILAAFTDDTNGATTEQSAVVTQNVLAVSAFENTVDT